MTVSDDDVLDHPVWASLQGPHSKFAQVQRVAVRYPAAMSSLAALDPEDGVGGWGNLASLLGPEQIAVLVGEQASPTASWATVRRVPCVQMVDVILERSTHGLAAAEVLGPDDVPEMLDLVRQTRPGPFTARTIELGTYLGLRRDGALVAMAGQRLRPPGWTEISAVCTHPDHRGQGLASWLLRRLCAEIRQRGDTPFLHAAVSNVAAIGLYESLGFAIRREIIFEAVRATDRMAS